MTAIPYGNKGPDCRVRLTQRLAWELSQLVSGYYPTNATKLGIPPDQFEALRTFVREARSVDTGFTMNLGTYEEHVLLSIRKLLKAVERYCTHTQVKKAARDRRDAFDDYLGLSAVDRLADVVKAG
jgi:hypothetical protein